jgi:hypothetical protein
MSGTYGMVDNIIVRKNMLKKRKFSFGKHCFSIENMNLHSYFYNVNNRVYFAAK